MLNKRYKDLPLKRQIIFFRKILKLCKLKKKLPLLQITSTSRRMNGSARNSRYLDISTSF